MSRHFDYCAATHRREQILLLPKTKCRIIIIKIVTPKLPKIKHVYQPVIYVTMTVSIERQLWGCYILVEGDNVYFYAYLKFNKTTE